MTSYASGYWVSSAGWFSGVGRVRGAVVLQAVGC